MSKEVFNQSMAMKDYTTFPKQERCIRTDQIDR
jgi:hypothetical protein